MKIKLGYVAVALNLPGITTSSTLTFTRYKKLMKEERINELKRITRSNMEALKKIFQYNIDREIHFYRLTSKLIPLASHPDVKNWNYKDFFNVELKEIGQIIKEHHLRVDTHPDHFNVINSTRETVFEATLNELKYHNNIFEMMNYPEGKMVMHIGSAMKGKSKSIERFIKNFSRLPQSIKERIILENDDKTFNVNETLFICRQLKIPMVLDYHHYICNKGETQIKKEIENIFNTWDGQVLVPKVHISSPRKGEYDRSHADFVRPEMFFDLINCLKTTDRDVDIMIESKQKDKALLKLASDVRKMDSGIKWLDESTMEI